MVVARGKFGISSLAEGDHEKNVEELTNRSLRRRLNEDFSIIPPELPQLPPRARSDTFSGDCVIVGGDDDCGDLIYVSDQDPSDLIGEPSDLISESSDFGSQPGIGGELPLDPTIRPQCLPDDNKTDGFNCQFQKCQNYGTESEFKDYISDIPMLETLHWNCDICNGCQCIQCDTCLHFEDGDCIHCNACLWDGLFYPSDSDNDYDDDGDLWEVPGQGNNVHEESDVKNDKEIILTEEAKANEAMKSDLVEVVLKNNLTHTATDDILGFLHTCNVGKLPKTAKTLLKTAKFVQLKEVPPGEYWHNEITKNLIKYASANNVSVINVAISADGVPLFNSTSKSFWPLTCKFNDDPEVHVIGLYLGDEKPADSNIFFQNLEKKLNHCVKMG